MAGFAEVIIKDSVPEWARPLIEWCHREILPEWNVLVKASEQPDPNDSTLEGVAHSHYYYLQTVLTIQRDAEETPENELVIIHEFCHPLLSGLQESTRRITTNETAYELFRDVEEISVVRISRILHKYWTMVKRERQDESNG